MGANVTVNKDVKESEINASIISVWKKVDKDLGAFERRKDLINEDLDSISDYVSNTRLALLNIKANANSLLGVLNSLLTYIKEED